MEGVAVEGDGQGVVLGGGGLLVSPADGSAVLELVGRRSVWDGLPWAAYLPRGIGATVIDPHGDLATELLDLIPRNRIEDVVYFNPADMEYPIGFNLLGDGLLVSG